MIRLRTAFKVEELIPYEVDCADHYFLPGPDRRVRHPDPFWVYEVPAEVLLGSALDDDVDLGSIPDKKAFFEAVKQLKERLTGGERA